VEGQAILFERNPDLEPTGKLSILGEARCSAERIEAYAKRRNPLAPDTAQLYLEAGAKYGIRGDVAFCQMLHDTRGWRRELSGPSWAPRTLEQWTDAGQIDLHMQLLHAFAVKQALPGSSPEAQRLLGAIDRAGWRGSAPCWEDLNGKWSAADSRYGQDIVAIWRNMCVWRGKGEVSMALGNGRGPETPAHHPRANSARGVDWSPLASEEMKWLQEKRVLPSPMPHPDRKVSWAELAALLYRLEHREAPLKEGDSAANVS